MVHFEEEESTVLQNLIIKRSKSYKVFEKIIGSAYGNNVTVYTLNQRRLVLQYIRNSTSYTDWKWDLLAGDIDDNFVEFVNNKNANLSIIFNCNNETKFFYDAYGNKIDFYHMMATLSGLLHYITEPNMIGWAGDLQSSVPDLINYMTINNIQMDYGNIYSTYYELLANNGLDHFSHEDLYADVDAYGIFVLMNNSTFTDLKAYLNYYYTACIHERFSVFTNYWEEDRIFEKTKHYLSYCLVLADWMVLTETQKNAIAQAFTDYLLEKIYEEQSY